MFWTCYCGCDAVLLWWQCSTLCSPVLCMRLCFRVIGHMRCIARFLAKGCQVSGRQCRELQCFSTVLPPADCHPSAASLAIHNRMLAVEANSALHTGAKSAILSCLVRNVNMLCAFRYWDSSYDDDLMEDRVAMNLLFLQVRHIVLCGQVIWQLFWTAHMYTTYSSNSVMITVVVITGPSPKWPIMCLVGR